MLIIDDSKSLNPLSTQLLMEVRGMREVEVVESIGRPNLEEMLRPSADELEIQKGVLMEKMFASH